MVLPREADAMKTVNEVSKLTGVSVRALHHYDAIGLLRPTAVTEAGYRLYDDEALARLQTVMLFRELKFPLAEIKSIIERPDFDRIKALEQQIELLRLQRSRLDELIELALEISRNGVNNMSFSAFDKTKIEEYAQQAKEKWGATQAYKEYEEKTKSHTPQQTAQAADGLMAHFVRLGKLTHLAPESEEVQQIIAELRQYITDNYYTCTPEIFASLGQMYCAGDSMTENIDKAGGAGTAQFAADAIAVYCKNLK